MKVFTKNDIQPEQLNQMFNDDAKCLAFLADMKWADGYTCTKCGNTNYCAGKEPHSRRCTRCKNMETATRGTLFHGIRFPVSKAFYIAYTVCSGAEGVSSYEFGRRLSLRQMTCWNFKSKIEQALVEFDTLSDEDRKSAETLRSILKQQRGTNTG